MHELTLLFHFQHYHLVKVYQKWSSNFKVNAYKGTEKQKKCKKTLFDMFIDNKVHDNYNFQKILNL